jgi:hypothetical protein
LIVIQQHCGQSAVLPHKASSMLQKKVDNTPAMDVARVYCPYRCGSKRFCSCLCANDICNWLGFTMFDCFRHWVKTKYIPHRSKNWSPNMLTVSQHIKHQHTVDPLTMLTDIKWKWWYTFLNSLFQSKITLKRLTAILLQSPV